MTDPNLVSALSEMHKIDLLLVNFPLSFGMLRRHLAWFPKVTMRFNKA